MDAKIMRDMQDKAVLWWQARPRRERTLLVLWGSAAAILLAWFAVVSPLSRRIDQLERRLPELESN